jgi:ribonucleotide reductase beta subunit family protein with ferritin-like domain
MNEYVEKVTKNSYLGTLSRDTTFVNYFEKWKMRHVKTPYLLREKKNNEVKEISQFRSKKGDKSLEYLSSKNRAFTAVLVLTLK